VDDIVEKESCGKGLREYCVEEGKCVEDIVGREYCGKGGGYCAEEKGRAGYCGEGEL
jgi:hypothetical protein